MSREAMEMPMEIQVIEIIFKHMERVYGNAFDQYKNVQIWAKELSGFRPHEIAYGLARLPEKLPDVIQFRDVCRMAPPPIVKMLAAPIDKERGLQEISKLKSLMRRA